ncbi:MAG: GreA/GreB family elongation factor [Myxococcales bacterium]|nr:GreA/GreB family elongation factor [Myxococcales bacterium]MCB9550771.1 GreA/GreB family elongation factor [Myxococcales bacterium]
MAKKPQKQYISAEGYKKITDEIDHLLHRERPEVVATVASAAAEGDRSENAEYIYGKKRLRQIDKRLEFLTEKLDEMEIVAPPTRNDKVRFLSYVEVENDDGDVRVFRIVGTDETDAKAGWISMHSPVGKALLGKVVDDEIEVSVPGRRVGYTILAIHNRDPRNG